MNGLLSWFMGRGPESTDLIERLANSELARSTKPDDIIVSHLVQSFLKDHDNWSTRINQGSLSKSLIPFDYWEKYQEPTFSADRRYELVGPQGNLMFNLDWRRTRRNSLGYETSGIVYVSRCRFTPTGKPIVEFHPALGDILVKHWNEIFLNIKEMNETAEKARKEMEENELKWQLAEEMLGMKRDENGVLQAVDKTPKPKKPRRPRVIKNPFGEQIEAQALVREVIEPFAV